MKKKVANLLPMLALMMGMFFLTACGDKCEDTCINGDCVSTTATQKECVCNEGYIGESCESAVNAELDFTLTTGIGCGATSVTFTPRAAPLTVSISGLGANSVVVEISENTGTFQQEPYKVNNLLLAKTALSPTEQIQGSGEYVRGNYFALDYEILDNQDNVIDNCQLSVFF